MGKDGVKHDLHLSEAELVGKATKLPWESECRGAF